MTQVEQLEIEKKLLEMENQELKGKVKFLHHEYSTTRGLWCIDRIPSEVSYKWIIENCFELK